MQGRLRKRKLSGLLTTECGHCGRPIEIEIDSELRLKVLSQGARPLISAPLVNLRKTKEPSIIDIF